ncbi:MAG: hypothetical protein KDD34_07980 [Bdellovibrionales bacterium]|nr:hypothetical protein [Bdellovibrionales bacterium]
MKAINAFTFVALFPFLLLSEVTFAGYGGSYFRSLRDDHTIPEKCREVELDNFATYDLETFTYGPIGAQNRGFTYEYPIRRDDARLLWDLGRMVVERGDIESAMWRLKSNPEALRDFQIMMDLYQEMDFNFHSEGEVLEILSIVETSKKLSDEFYVTGSVAYSDKVAGELDLMIGRKSDCQIFSIGEAKLGLKSLNHAHEQLERFKSFLKKHIHKILNPFDLQNY